jgi:hypothetical protein
MSARPTERYTHYRKRSDEAAKLAEAFAVTDKRAADAPTPTP